MPYSIMIDAGHGGNDPGAVYKGRREKDDNLALAMDVGRLLSENGIEVLYTRTTDDYISPFEREQTTLSPFTAIPARNPTSITEWKCWFMTKAESSMRWRRTL